ncbi:hypothetical protein PLESTM_001506800 [Pleodorina starrii]|nr:hypothetical protein PLESTM_001506800 [Pleodorina starrii]
MSEWFASTSDEPVVKQGVVSEVLCELPPKLTQRSEALHGRHSAFAAANEKIHGDDLRTFPSLFNGEDVSLRQRRWLSLQAAAAKLEGSFEAFGRDRDRDDFQRLWVNFLAPHSPQRLLAPAAPRQHHAPALMPPTAAPTAAATGPGPGGGGAIPTLLLSTNGASMADRLDLYGAFASYLREQQGAYVALLRPEDLAAGVGGCFGSALAQLSGLGDSAAEDVLGLVAWYEQETGRGTSLEPRPTQPNAETSAAAAAAPTPAKGPAKTPGRAAAKTPRGRAGKGKTPRGRGAVDAEEEEGGGDAGEGEGEGTVAARLRARRGQLGQAAAAAAEAEARAAREARAAVHARNRGRHVVLLVEAAGRVADRGSLRALLAALHGERHRLPVTLVLGLSSPAGLYGSKLPADVASLLQLTAAELAPHPRQLHRLFQDVLLAPQSPPALLLDGSTMRELLMQCRLLEPSLACIQAALREAHEQHFRREALAPLALLPLQQHQADEAAAAATARRAMLPAAAAAAAGRRKDRREPGGGATAAAADDDSSSDGEEHESSPGSSPYKSAQSEDGADGGDGDGEGELGEGPYGLAEADPTWLARRRQRHGARLAAAVSELPTELLRTACADLLSAAAAAGGGECGKENGGGGGGGKGAKSGSGRGGSGGQRQEQMQEAVCEAVTEAFSSLSAWRLGLRWLALLAERTGATQLPGGHRYALPSLYVAAASPKLWKPPAAAVAAAVAASCSAAAAAAGQHPHRPGGVAAARSGPSAAAAALASSSLGETLLAGVLGPTVAGAVVGGSAGSNTRGTLRALPEQELDLVLDELMEAAREALTGDWLPAEAVMAAGKGLAKLVMSHSQGAAAEEEEGHDDEGGKGGGGAAEEAEEDETSPVRRRLAAQGLMSPPTAEKLQGVMDRLGRLDPLPAPKLLQPNNAQPPPQPQPRRGGAQTQPSRKPAGGVVPPQGTAAGAATGAAAAAGAGGASHASVKLPSSGQTQSKRQRAQALLAAVQQHAAAGPAAAAAAAEARGGAGVSSAPRSLADLAAEFLATALRELLSTCPFQLPGSAAFTFSDAAGLQRRLVGAPSLALHTALTQPERFIGELAPGLHPGQEDAAIAYQLLVGSREGVDVRDWLADFCAASGLGKMQEVQEDGEEEEAADADQQGDGPMGRSRTSRRRHAPRKRKAAPKQEMVLSLDGPQAEAAVDALACRFEQVARELEAVGLCRFSKRRKGMYAHRTYFPPEAVA